jgi:hypothetical protein
MLIAFLLGILFMCLACSHPVRRIGKPVRELAIDLKTFRVFGLSK